MKRKDLKYFLKNLLYFIYIYQRWDVYEVWNCFQRPLMSAHCTTHLNYNSAKCTAIIQLIFSVSLLNTFEFTVRICVS